MTKWEYDCDIRALREKVQSAIESFEAIRKHCLCAKFHVPGFDYGETHARLGKNKPGSRWLDATAIAQIAADELRKGLNYEDNVNKIIRRHIQGVLRAEGGNRTRAAKRLGISLRTLRNKIKKWEAE